MKCVNSGAPGRPAEVRKDLVLFVSFGHDVGLEAGDAGGRESRLEEYRGLTGGPCRDDSGCGRI